MFRKITSHSMLISFFIMSFTGIILFLAPSGKLARMVGWEFLGLDKHDYATLHITFMVLFLIFGIFHIYYNWKSFICYWQNRTKKVIVFTKEFIIALLIAIIFFIGTIYEISPFKEFIDLGHEIGENWASLFIED